MFVIDYFFTRRTTIKRFTSIGEINYYIRYRKDGEKFFMNDIDIHYAELYTNEYYDLSDDRMVFNSKEELRKQGYTIGDELVNKYIRARFNIRAKFFDNRIDYLRNLHSNVNVNVNNERKKN